MAFVTNYFLIGTQKAGTTSLAHLLDQHPDVCLSDPKETHFFSIRWEQGLDWYRSCFANPDAPVLLDGSTTYSMAPLNGMNGTADRVPALYSGVPARIHAMNPGARFIYVLRDPIVRAYSSYWHGVRISHETLPFEEAIRTNSLYVRTSEYYGQLEKYLEYFTRESFLFIKYEDFSASPEATLKACWDFMGLQPIELPGHVLTARKYRSFRYTGLGRAVRSKFPSNASFQKFKRSVRKAVPAPVYNALTALATTSIPQMSERERELLRPYFQDSVENLQRITNLDLSDWLK